MVERKNIITERSNFVERSYFVEKNPYKIKCEDNASNILETKNIDTHNIWNPYPKRKPEYIGYYGVTLRVLAGINPLAFVFWNGIKWVSEHTVLAWKIPPEPYRE